MKAWALTALLIMLSILFVTRYARADGPFAGTYSVGSSGELRISTDHGLFFGEFTPKENEVPAVKICLHEFANELIGSGFDCSGNRFGIRIKAGANGLVLKIDTINEPSEWLDLSVKQHVLYTWSTCSPRSMRVQEKL